MPPRAASAASMSGGDNVAPGDEVAAAEALWGNGVTSVAAGCERMGGLPSAISPVMEGSSRAAASPTTAMPALVCGGLIAAALPSPLAWVACSLPWHAAGSVLIAGTPADEKGMTRCPVEVQRGHAEERAAHLACQNRSRIGVCRHPALFSGRTGETGTRKATVLTHTSSSASRS